MSKTITVDGVEYAPISEKASKKSIDGANVWKEQTIQHLALAMAMAMAMALAMALAMAMALALALALAF